MCQHVQVNPMLRARLLAELGRKKVSFDPEDYDVEEWDSVIVPEGVFDINIWFPDENTFAITAYFTEENSIGQLVADNTRFFRLFQKEYRNDKS